MVITRGSLLGNGNDCAAFVLQLLGPLLHHKVQQSKVQLKSKPKPQGKPGQDYPTELRHKGLAPGNGGI